LRAQEAAQNVSLGTPDAGLIPAALRGYVRVAISRWLLSTHGAYFRPRNPASALDFSLHIFMKHLYVNQELNTNR